MSHVYTVCLQQYNNPKYAAKSTQETKKHAVQCARKKPAWAPQGHVCRVCLSPKYILFFMLMLGCGNGYLYYVCTFDALAKLLVDNQLALNAVMQVWHPIISLFCADAVSSLIIHAVLFALSKHLSILFPFCHSHIFFLHNILSKIVNLIYILQ